MGCRSRGGVCGKEAIVAKFWKTPHIFFSRPKVAFAKRKNICTEVWARAETGGHAYRRGTVLVLAGRDDLSVQFGGLVGGGAPKSAPFKNRRDAAPGNSTALVWMVWKGVPPASRNLPSAKFPRESVRTPPAAKKAASCAVQLRPAIKPQRNPPDTTHAHPVLAGSGAGVGVLRPRQRPKLR